MGGAICSHNLYEWNKQYQWCNNKWSLNSAYFISVILYGEKAFDNVTNFRIITTTITVIKTTKRFEEALF